MVTTKSTFFPTRTMSTMRAMSTMRRPDAHTTALTSWSGAGVAYRFRGGQPDRLA